MRFLLCCGGKGAAAPKDLAAAGRHPTTYVATPLTGTLRTSLPRTGTLDVDQWAAAHGALHDTDANGEDLAMRDNPMFHLSAQNSRSLHGRASWARISGNVDAKALSRAPRSVRMGDRIAQAHAAASKQRRLSKGQRMIMARILRTKAHASRHPAALRKTRSDLSIVAKVEAALPKPQHALHRAKTVGRLQRKSSYGRLETAAVAATDYAAASDREVSLAAGDAVSVLRRHHSDGWEGWTTVRHTASGRSGLVPSSFLVPHGGSEAGANPRARFRRNSSRGRLETTGDRSQGGQPPQQQQNKENLSSLLKKDHEERRNLSSILKQKKKTRTRNKRQSSFGRLEMRQVKTVGAAYKARDGTHEISLAVGDRVTALRRHHSDGWEGWTSVQNHTSGERGIVPTSYLSSHY